MLGPVWDACCWFAGSQHRKEVNTLHAQISLGCWCTGGPECYLLGTGMISAKRQQNCLLTDCWPTPSQPCLWASFTSSILLENIMTFLVYQLKQHNTSTIQHESLWESSWFILGFSARIAFELAELALWEMYWKLHSNVLELFFSHHSFCLAVCMQKVVTWLGHRAFRKAESEWQPWRILRDSALYQLPEQETRGQSPSP